MKIVAVSDTHGRWNKLEIPECDILISAGDYSFKGESHIVKDFHKWLNKQKAKHIVSVQGNHEVWVQANFEQAKQIALEACPRAHFLQHDSIEIEDIKIFGSAWTPFFYDWAWNAHRTLELAQTFSRPYIWDKWKNIPLDTDILITHGPPHKILDELVDIHGYPKGEFVGCENLSIKIKELKKLKHHIFGHIHFWGGQTVCKDGIMYHNASICDEKYMPINPITIFDYEKD